MSEEDWEDLPQPVVALLREVAVLLDRLVREGEPEAIDLRALPVMTPEDLESFRDALGTGEVHATVTALGETTVRETAFPAVWWVTYYGADGDIVAERIEVARVPDILVTQEADMGAGLRALVEALPEPREGGPAAPEGPSIRWVED
ncbi:MAG TPA: hydrogenase expression/formation C-terminal domain-containing protein [Gammaproteobacteria bacterium]|nr:hydrogenase expression/formation C-terminal domain-containing protein [Gammaproteobacteria bacterium]